MATTSYDKEKSIGPIYYDKVVDSSHNHNMSEGEEGSVISFGGFHDHPAAQWNNPFGGITSGYHRLIGNPLPTSDQDLDLDLDLDLDDCLKNSKTGESNSQLPVTVSNTNTPKSNSTNNPVNNFPLNVKSLLSTGIFDGVPVKYVSWSQQINFKGIIKGTGYLCLCDACKCKQSKALNAHEFARHAGLEIKHPNNHIYFDNGKTLYAVVQELKNTPREMLFDAIQNVSGSTINQKNFRTWKASYQAATQELQRIYGKDDVVKPS